MPELFWIIVGYTVVLTLCFLLGEYLQDRRTAGKRKVICQKKTACPPDKTEHPCSCGEEATVPEDPSYDP